MKILDKYLFEINIKQTLMKIKDLTPISAKKLSTPLLVDYHRKTHMLYNSAIKRSPINKIFINDIIDIHDILVDEMIKRKFKHNTPMRKI